MPSPVIYYSWNFEGAVLMMVNIVWPPGGVKTAKDALLLPRKLHWNPEISETNGGNRIFWDTIQNCGYQHICLNKGIHRYWQAIPMRVLDWLIIKNLWGNHTGLIFLSLVLKVPKTSIPTLSETLALALELVRDQSTDGDQAQVWHGSSQVCQLLTVLFNYVKEIIRYVPNSLSLYALPLILGLLGKYIQFNSF